MSNSTNISHIFIIDDRIKSSDIQMNFHTFGNRRWVYIGILRKV